MITVRFDSGAGGAITAFTVSGHAGCAESGRDIVCAAVSSAAYMAANTVTEVLGLSPEIEEREGFLQLRFSSGEAETARVVLLGLQLHITALCEQYPEYIQVERGAL